jgi:hypothetical protein
MTVRVGIPLCFMVLGLWAAAEPAEGQTQPGVYRTVVIDVAAEHYKLTARDRIVDLVRSRLPVAIRYGRFATNTGESHLCIFSRRSIGRGMSASPASPFSVSPCAMIDTYLDGRRINRPDWYFERTSPLAVASIELVSAAQANRRYGLGARDPEVLLLWTPGRGKTSH